MNKLLTICCLLLIYPTGVGATDWSACESELTTTKREARDAADYASTLNSLEGELESVKEEYESCVQHPDTDDDDGDGCESKKYYYDSSVEEYNSAQSELNSLLDEIIRRVKDLMNSCG